jgi:outer membrane protein assembly factor BamB
LNGSTGQKIWNYTTGSRVYSSPCVADLFGNGKLEVIVGSFDDNVYCLDGSTGQKIWNYTTNDLLEFISPCVADLFGNGRLEVIVGSSDDRVYCLNGTTGHKIWNYPTGGAVYSSPCVADLFGNGKLEVIVGSGDHNVYCLNGTTGDKIWNYRTGDAVFSSPCVSDLFGNGKLEVIVGSSDDRVYCLNGTSGQQIWSYTTGGWIDSSPSVDDLFGNGRLEVVIGSSDSNVYCLNMTIGAPWSAGAFAWPSIGFRGDVRHTGCYVDSDHDGLTDAYEQTVPKPDADAVEDMTYQKFLASSNPWVDNVLPATIANLAATSPTNSSLTLTWTAPGDAGNKGNATGYWVKYSTAGPINDSNWASATNYTQTWTPAKNGTAETHVINGLTQGTKYWFAVEAYDDATPPNYGGVSNSPSATTIAPAPPGIPAIIIVGALAVLVLVVIIVAVVFIKRKKPS